MLTNLSPIGRDITGRGLPNLVITEWSGGAHCCYKFHIFELGDAVKTVSVLDAKHGSFSHFADLDGDNIPEFVTWDWTFAYWKTSFAGSPAPKIILRFEKDKYVVAEKLMRKPALSPKEIKAKIAEIRADDSWKSKYPLPPPLFWETMLDLIYTGNMNAAWMFFDKAWVKGVKGKKEFLRQFREQLATSPYWVEIGKMNARQTSVR